MESQSRFRPFLKIRFMVFKRRGSHGCEYVQVRVQPRSHTSAGHVNL